VDKTVQRTYELRMRGKADETKALLAGVLAENFKSLGGELRSKELQCPKVFSRSILD